MQAIRLANHSHLLAEAAVIVTAHHDEFAPYHETEAGKVDVGEYDFCPACRVLHLINLLGDGVPKLREAEYAEIRRKWFVLG